MVLSIVAYAYQSIKDSVLLKYGLYAVAALILLRIWSSTPSLRVKRVLAGKTVIISGGLTPLNLSLLRSLAIQGAQVILLHKEPSSPAVQQIIHLVQYASDNERVYAESCDTTGTSASLISIASFCEKWRKNKRRSPLGEDLGYETIDTLILSDDEVTTKDGFGTRDQREKYYGACLRAKLAIVDGLLPVLKQSNTRIINVVSPFYAASPPIKIPSVEDEEKDKPWTLSSWIPRHPWTFAASPALSSIAMMARFSRAPYDLCTISVSPGISRAWVTQILTANPSIKGWSALICLSPLIWALCKSNTECTNAIEKAIHADLKETAKRKDGIRAGALIVKGRAVNLRRTELTDATFADLVWQRERAVIQQAPKASSA